MRGGFRTRLFLATVGIAASVLVLASTLTATSLRRQTYERLERGLIGNARLAAELLSHRVATSSVSELQQEAQTLAHDVEARLTLIAADGRVIGDSSLDGPGVAEMENHGSRPEVIAARRHGIGIATRFSATLSLDMLYVAAPVRHPSIAFVRLAMPLTEIQRQLCTIWQSTLYAFLFSVFGAFGLSWIASALLARRLNRLATDARQYASGTGPATPRNYGNDEIGTVARVLEESVRRLGDRAADLARDRARMEAILGSMVEGVLAVDPGGRIQLVNAAARRILRLDAAVEGLHYRDCIRSPDVVVQIDAACESVAGMPGDTLVNDGRLVFVASVAPVNTAQGHGAVLVLHDITEFHRADQVRRDFVANVSHELRTPLTAIRGYAEALSDDVVDHDDRRRFLDIIARHSLRMERLTKDLLRLAQLEAGHEPSAYAACDVAELFETVVADLQPAISAKQQRTEIRVAPEAAAISADPMQLHDAIRNLVENAVVYSPEGGVITLEARLRGGEVRLTVSDEGPGIPAADLQRVFERFYRVDKARSRESGGTGLGLSIVKHIVERMDGRVDVTNRTPHGAVFTIHLPYVPVAQTVDA